MDKQEHLRSEAEAALEPAARSIEFWWLSAISFLLATYRGSLLSGNRSRAGVRGEILQGSMSGPGARPGTVSRSSGWALKRWPQRRGTTMCSPRLVAILPCSPLTVMWTDRGFAASGFWCEREASAQH